MFLDHIVFWGNIHFLFLSKYSQVFVVIFWSFKLRLTRRHESCGIQYLSCLPGLLNIRVTSEQHVPRVAETRNVSVVSQKHLRVSSYKFCRAAKFPGWLYWKTSGGKAKLGDMSRATLSHVTCPLDVSQFRHFGNFVVRDKICSERHANVIDRQQKHFLSPCLKDMLLACHSHA